jgi:hypothetical protein
MPGSMPGIFVFQPDDFACRVHRNSGRQHFTRIPKTIVDSIGGTMKCKVWAPRCLLGMLLIASGALAHDCRVKSGYLIGHYEGGCNEKNETANGHGEAKGADSFVGDFINGRLDGRGVYIWENGARLDGTFKADKANGPGVYVSAKGVRYEGPFENGKLTGAKREDCPMTQGPLEG